MIYVVEIAGRAVAGFYSEREIAPESLFFDNVLALEPALIGLVHPALVDKDGRRFCDDESEIFIREALPEECARFEASVRAFGGRRAGVKVWLTLDHLFQSNATDHLA